MAKCSCKQRQQLVFKVPAEMLRNLEDLGYSYLYPTLL